MAIPSHRQHSFSVGLGEAMAALGAFPTAPISWEGLGCPGSTSVMPGDSAHSSVSNVLGSPQTPATLHPAATTSPCAKPCVPPVQLQCNQCWPCGSLWGMVTGSVGSSLFHSRADESLDKNAARFWVDLF